MTFLESHHFTLNVVHPKYTLLGSVLKLNENYKIIRGIIFQGAGRFLVSSPYKFCSFPKTITISCFVRWRDTPNAASFFSNHNTIHWWLLLFALSLMFFIALEGLHRDQHPLQYRALPVFHWLQYLQVKPFQAVTPYRKIPLKCYPTKASITFYKSCILYNLRSNSSVKDLNYVQELEAWKWIGLSTLLLTVVTLTSSSFPGF